MLISPQAYIEKYKDLKYEELLPVRDKLIRDIRRYEKQDNKTGLTADSSEVIYQHKLKCLAKLCQLIAEKYNEEIVWGGKKPGKGGFPFK